MKVLAFLLCLMVGGSFAFVGERCDYSRCRESNPVHALEDVRFMPNAQELRDLCPKMLEFLDCNINVIESCVGKSITELASSSNKTVAEGTETLLSIGSLIRDVCNPHTTFHKDYVASIECFRGFAIVGTRLCQIESEETMQDFYSKSKIEKGGLDDALNAEIRCLETAYEVTCFSLRLGESCGERARKTFVNVAKRLVVLVDNQCKGSSSSNLKNKFYDYMEVDDEQMGKIKETLDLFRRR